MNRAIFLDRDGTLIVEKNYLHRPADVEIFPGAGAALSRLSAATLVQLSLADMIGQSTAIEHAKVLSSWAAFSGPAIFTHYKLQVSERLKGTAISEIVAFGGDAGGVNADDAAAKFAESALNAGSKIFFAAELVTATTPPALTSTAGHAAFSSPNTTFCPCRQFL